MESAQAILDEPNFSSISRHVNALVDDPTADNISTLKALLLVRASDTYGKRIIPRYVSRTFLNFGVDGINMLESILPEAPVSIYPVAILGTIYHASRGEQGKLRVVCFDDLVDNARRLYSNLHRTI